MQVIKRYVVWIALAATLILVVLSEPDDTENLDVETPVATEVRSQVSAETTFVADADTDNFILREPTIDVAGDMFSVPQREKPQQKAKHVRVERQRPPPPVNPYRYVGKLVENDEIIVFLTNGRDNFAVATGDILEQTWKVSFISSTQMILLNLPTQSEITVEIGALL